MQNTGLTCLMLPSLWLVFHISLAAALALFPAVLLLFSYAGLHFREAPQLRKYLTAKEATV